MSIRLLVVDDHPFYREGIKTLLSTSPERVLVVGEAATGEEALEQASRVEPDVVLMDLQMPGIGGVAATRKLLADHPHLRILVLTMHDDDMVLPALRAGAHGYLLKDAGIEDVLRAIEAVAAGQSVLAPQAATRLNRHLASPRTPQKVFPELTDREHLLLSELVRGRSTHEIARELGVTEKTVRNYISNILTKLRVRDRAQLVAKAHEAGFEPTDQP